MRKFLTLSVALLSLLAGTAGAQDLAASKTVVPTASVGETNGGAVRYRYPLSKFVATPGPLMLRDASMNAKIAIPLSARLKLKTMTLTLTFTSSIALKPETSVMSVRFNETTLAQIRLDSKSPIVTARVNLPVELARPGYNTLALSLTQHNGQDCEDPEAPELWTEVNTVDSALEIDGEYVGTPLRLSDFEQIVSPGIGGARRLAIVTPPLAKDAALIEAGGLVAQAVALRSQYESVDLKSVTLAGAPAAGDAWALDDQIVIGTKEQIAALLDAGEAAKISGPYLGLRSLDRRQMRMIVSGTTPQDVITAARALTYMDIPLADAVSADIKTIKAPSSRAKTLQPDRIYGFEELGVPTTTLSGNGTQKVTLNLPMPPDLYAPEQAALDMLLDLNYGAGTGAGSVINVDINGKFLHGINLGEQNGAAYRGYRIAIPLRDLVGGTNQINFNVIMRPVRVGACAGTSGRHLALTLFGTSSIQLPIASRVASQPDLDLMVRTGYPYAEADGTPTTLWVSDPSLLGAGWTLLGRLAQVSGSALPKVQFAIGGEPPRGPSILIGEAKSLPPRVFASAQQAIGEVNRVPYRVFAGPIGVAAPTVLERLWPFSQAPRKPDQQLPAGAVEQVNDLGDNLVLTAVRADGAGTATVVTAASRERLIEGMHQLTSLQYWGQARGDFMLWKRSSDSVVTLRLSPRYQIGADSPGMTVRFYISQHPWYWLGGTVLVLMLLSGLTVWVLARRRPPSA